ncbi:MAG: hypothetical protein IPP77_09305 [Bacteroidetes bacterium]|nr:hypothetical protein [Bacteroidota bacterium]
MCLQLQAFRRGVVGWRSLIGNGSAYNPITHLNTNFGAGNQYFNVAFRATNDGTAFANNTYWTLNGAAGGALAPVLEVDYTSPASPPSCTSYISPTNAITNSATGVQLTWNAEGSADSYDVYFGTSSTPPLAGNTASITYNPGCLLPNTQYYWQIVPKNTYGSASGCSVWSFTTADKDSHVHTEL